MKDNPTDRFIAKLITDGETQVVRLPKECRIPADTVRVMRAGARLIIEPLASATSEQAPADQRRWSPEAAALLFSGTADPELLPERDQPPMQERPELEDW